MESGSMAAPRPAGGDGPQGSAHGEKGLKTDALGYISNLVIGVASTAPAYTSRRRSASSSPSPASGARAGRAARLVRPDAVRRGRLPLPQPGRPRLRHDASPGSRARSGPQLGWLNGWAIVVADIIVMATLAQIAGKLHVPARRLGLGRRRTGAAIVVGGRLDRGDDVDLLTAASSCPRAIQSCAADRRDRHLALFAVVALVKVYASNPADSITPQPRLVQPVRPRLRARSSTACCSAIFIYWGWDSGVAVNEESEDRTTGPGRAAVVSTILLVLIYVVVSAAAQAYDGTGFLDDNSDDVLSVLGTEVFGSPLGQAADPRRAHLGVGVDADDDPADRAHDAVDGALGRDPRGFGASTRASDADLLDALDGRGLDRLDGRSSRAQPSQNVLGDSISALGFAIASTTASPAWRARSTSAARSSRACATSSWPGSSVLGFVMMAYVFDQGLHDYDQGLRGGLQLLPAVVGIEIADRHRHRRPAARRRARCSSAWFATATFFRRKLEVGTRSDGPSRPPANTAARDWSSAAAAGTLASQCRPARPSTSPPPPSGGIARGGRKPQTTREEAEGRSPSRRERHDDQDPDRVLIFDTTLRDGEQSPGISLNTTEKLEIAHQLARLGVDVIEAGFPIASPGDFEAVQAIAREVHGPIIAGLARANPADVDARLGGGARRRAPADPHLRLDLRHPHRAPAAVHARGRQGPGARRRSRSASGSSTTSSSRRWTPRAPTSTSRPRSCRSRSTRARRRSTSPTPSATRCRTSTRRPGARSTSCAPGLNDVALSVHCHDDLGLAVANSFAGVLAGARQVECAINGIGERAGNASLEEIVMLLHTRRPTSACARAS